MKVAWLWQLCSLSKTQKLLFDACFDPEKTGLDRNGTYEGFRSFNNSACKRVQLTFHTAHVGCFYRQVSKFRRRRECRKKLMVSWRDRPFQRQDEGQRADASFYCQSLTHSTAPAYKRLRGQALVWNSMIKLRWLWPPCVGDADIIFSS